MFKTVFSKTLYEKRWTMVFWTLGVTAMGLLMMGFYHSFQNFDQVLQNLPKSVRGLVGNVDSLKTVAGYVAQQVFALRIPLLTLVMGITLFTGLLAGDEGEGTLQTLLAQPVSRLKVFIEKILAGMATSFVICCGAILGVLLGVALIHEQISFIHLFEATVDVWLLTLVFSSIGFALGAITGKRGMSGALTGLLTFGSYLITSFAPNVSYLASADKLSPFHYYNHPATSQYGLQTHNVLVMIGIVVVAVAISGLVFLKRDIYQR